VAAALRPSAGRVRRVAAPTVAPEPEVLVPAEEIAMYRRLFAAVKQVPRAFVVEGPHDIVAPGSVSEIAIDPIRIDLIAPPPGGEGDRQ
jgi:hypothetical protein